MGFALKLVPSWLSGTMSYHATEYIERATESISKLFGASWIKGILSEQGSELRIGHFCKFYEFTLFNTKCMDEKELKNHNLLKHFLKQFKCMSKFFCFFFWLMWVSSIGKCANPYFNQWWYIGIYRKGDIIKWQGFHTYYYYHYFLRYYSRPI